MPLLPPSTNKPIETNIEPLATYILSIHHIVREFPFQDFKNQLQEILATNLNTQPPYTNNLASTPPHTKVNPSNQWTNTNTYIQINHNTNLQNTQPECPKYDNIHPLKYPTNNDYTNGSFIPPKPNEPKEPSDIAGYGIYNKE
jgi:hypothetical protein